MEPTNAVATTGSYVVVVGRMQAAARSAVRRRILAQPVLQHRLEAAADYLCIQNYALKIRGEVVVTYERTDRLTDMMNLLGLAMES